MITAEKVPRPNTVDHISSFSYSWRLTGKEDGARKDSEGTAIAVAAAKSKSIQTSGPLVLLGSNDGANWYEIMRCDEAGLYQIPHAVRSLKPIGLRDKATLVVLFFTV